MLATRLLTRAFQTGRPGGFSSVDGLGAARPQPKERGQLCPPEIRSATKPRADLAVRAPGRAPNATISHKWSAGGYARRKCEAPRNRVRTWQSALPTQPYHANGARAAMPAENGERHATACGLGSPRSQAATISHKRSAGSHARWKYEAPHNHARTWPSALLFDLGNTPLRQPPPGRPKKVPVWQRGWRPSVVKEEEHTRNLNGIRRVLMSGWQETSRSPDAEHEVFLRWI